MRNSPRSFLPTPPLESLSPATRSHGDEEIMLKQELDQMRIRIEALKHSATSLALDSGRQYRIEDNRIFDVLQEQLHHTKYQEREHILAERRLLQEERHALGDQPTGILVPKALKEKWDDKATRLDSALAAKDAELETVDTWLKVTPTDVTNSLNLPRELFVATQSRVVSAGDLYEGIATMIAGLTPELTAQALRVKALEGT